MSDNISFVPANVLIQEEEFDDFKGLTWEEIDYRVLDYSMSTETFPRCSSPVDDETNDNVAGPNDDEYEEFKEGLTELHDQMEVLGISIPPENVMTGHIMRSAVNYSNPSFNELMLFEPEELGQFLRNKIYKRSQSNNTQPRRNLWGLSKSFTSAKKTNAVEPRLAVSLQFENDADEDITTLSSDSQPPEKRSRIQEELGEGTSASYQEPLRHTSASSSFGGIFNCELDIEGTPFAVSVTGKPITDSKMFPRRYGKCTTVDEDINEMFSDQGWGKPAQKPNANIMPTNPISLTTNNECLFPDEDEDGLFNIDWIIELITSFHSEGLGE